MTKIELQKGARRGTVVIIADGQEVGRAEYNSAGKRGGYYTFYHPAPKHGGVFLIVSIEKHGGGTIKDRRIAQVNDKADIEAKARELYEGGHLKPVAHWQAVAAKEKAKREADEAAEDARERVHRAGPAMLKALKALVEWAAHMGGWDAPAWKQAEQAIRQAEEG